jgi:hypothetical protein
MLALKVALAIGGGFLAVVAYIAWSIVRINRIISCDPEECERQHERSNLYGE